MARQKQNELSKLIQNFKSKTNNYRSISHQLDDKLKSNDLPTHKLYEDTNLFRT